MLNIRFFFEMNKLLKIIKLTFATFLNMSPEWIEIKTT